IAARPAAPAAFLDVAPRANMLNIFRRSGNPVSVGGQSFVPVDDSWCAQNALQTPATGSASKLITVPDAVWGITNVGTAQVGAAFLSRLSANGQTLEQTTVAANTLAPGATQNTSFTRARSTVRVVRFGPPNPP